MTRRLLHVASTESRLLWRYRVVAAVLAVTAIWCVLLRVATPDLRSSLVPLVLFFDLTGLGFFFVPAMVMVERSEGVLAATMVSRLSPGELALVRVSAVTMLALVASVVVLVAAGVGLDESPTIVAGVVLTSVLGSLLALALARDLDTFTAFMTRVPLVALLLLAPAIVELLGLSRSAFLQLSPMASGAALLSGRFSMASVAWMLVWIFGLFRFVRAHPLAAPSEARLRTSALWSRRLGPLRSFARADRLSLLRDVLALMILAGVPLVALAARGFAELGVPWLAGRYGFDAAPWLPLVWALLLVVHTPVMFGSIAGLLFLEERDAGLLPAIAVTRASLRALLAYRLGAATLATVVMTWLGFAIAGVRHPGGAPALVATAVGAGAVAPVTALLMTTFAANRAQGMAAMKMITLPLYLPAALWFAGGAARHALDAVPSAWPVHALWASSSGEAALDASVGVALSALLVVVLARRFERRVAV